MDFFLHRRVFGGHAKAIPAHRMQHSMAGHRLIPRQHIAHRVIADMPHMDAPRWIGEHFQDVRFWTRIGGGRSFEHRLLFPDFLPMPVRFERVKT